MRSSSLVLFAALVCAALAVPAFAEVGPTLVVVKPQYLSPADVSRLLDARAEGGRTVVEWRTADGVHSVEVRLSDAANGVILAGTPSDIASVQALVTAADLPPRQIAIEARIVEVDESKARDLGIDWSRVSASASLGQRADWNSQRMIQQQNTLNRAPGYDNRQYSKYDSKQEGRVGSVTEFARIDLYSALTLLDQNQAATYRDAPRILTLNNHRATILDGQHVTYVTRYSAATNLYATDSMEAGLRLSVLPSLGESGYLKLDLRAELTSLRGDISGSPVKDGQVVENTVMVKDGDSVLLGGFTRTVSEVTHRRFPVLGSVLPFLFSRDIVNHSQRQTFFVITPRVVDLASGMDSSTKGAVEGR